MAAIVAAPAAAVEQLADKFGEPGAAAVVGFLRDAMAELLRVETDSARPLSDPAELERYLCGTMGSLPHEQVRVLFLNSRNILIRDEVVSTGTVNAVSVYPREILKRALELGATALILVHNHPSGDLEPSRNDLIETRRLCQAANTLEIQVNDHLIVTRYGATSLRAKGFIHDSADMAASGGSRSVVALARTLYAARVRIGRYFADDLFADPARDILLELFADSEEGRLTDVTMSCISARVPMSTALRWLAELVQRGLVIRTPHPNDRRRWLVSLAPAAREAMRAYLTSIAKPLSDAAWPDPIL